MPAYGNWTLALFAPSQNSLNTAIYHDQCNFDECLGVHRIRSMCEYERQLHKHEEWWCKHGGGKSTVEDGSSTDNNAQGQRRRIGTQLNRNWMSNPSQCEKSEVGSVQAIWKLIYISLPDSVHICYSISFAHSRHFFSKDEFGTSEHTITHYYTITL